MNGRVILTVGLAAVFVMGYYGTSSVAFAQYMGNVGSAGETGQHTLEENLELAQRRLEIISDNPGSGSGTPYLDASGVLGASIIAGAVFGGIAAAFFVRARSGRYAAMGRG
ncbi:MAG: hypothetical protein J4G04_02405 [Nitrosopumilaceae archaeon]|nr:hypothetical protein [Nitrosopumilaceae archaeon]